MANRNRSNEDETDQDRVSAMADRLKLKGEAKRRYVHKHMTGLGYRPKTTYDPPGSDDDDDDDDDDNGFF